MIRHALAPIHSWSARSLGVARTLPSVPDPPAVAITFDDGPHPEGTPRILEILAAHGAVASFFTVGEQVLRRPELLRRMRAEGHAVALHGHRHQLMLRRSAAALRDDLRRGAQAIAEAIGEYPVHHRPPYGIYSAAGLAAARELELSPLLWADWGRDWRRHTTPEQIRDRVLRHLAPGDVILLHDADFYSAERSHERTAAALELILTELSVRGIATVHVV
jgi:peptidoglycan/xylan/chitin deacetylase (PgdA/CDA1 family)